MECLGLDCFSWLFRCVVPTGADSLAASSTGGADTTPSPTSMSTIGTAPSPAVTESPEVAAEGGGTQSPVPERAGDVPATTPSPGALAFSPLSRRGVFVCRTFLRIMSLSGWSRAVLFCGDVFPNQRSTAPSFGIRLKSGPEQTVTDQGRKDVHTRSMLLA